MARVHYSRFVGRAGKSRLPTKALDAPGGWSSDGPRVVLVCRRGDYIEKGQRYLWFAPGFRAAKQIGCMSHPPKPSEMDSSLYSEVLSAQEDAGTALDAISWYDESADDIRTEVEDAIQPVKDAIDSVAEQYESAAEAMGGESGAGSQMAEWAQALRDSEIVDWDPKDGDDPDDGDESARCDEHTPESEGGKATIDPEADDAYDSEATLEQAAADCSECAELRKADLTDWTSDLVDEAREKVDAVSKEG